MNSTIKILLRSDYTNIDGSKTVYLRFTANRKVKYYSLNIKVKPQDLKGIQVKRSDPEYVHKNTLIYRALNKARNIIYDHTVKELPLTILMFTRCFLNSNYGNTSFIAFAESEIEILKPKRAQATIKSYNSQINKLKKYSPDITFNDLTQHFIKTYENYLIQVLANNRNTVNKTFRTLRIFLNLAINQKLIEENPLNGHWLPKSSSQREFLTQNELKELETLYKSNKLAPNKQNVLKYFLFSCYTGLRYQDVKDLKFNQVKENIISIVMHKTKDQVRIPVVDQARNLIDPDPIFINQRIFKVLSNQPTNRYLKDIMTVVKIDKQISFHCARYTFATLALKLGIPIDVISKLLGHTNLKVTQGYIRYLDDLKIQEMKKWENI